jgi:histidinol-phosphate aminotransferase
MVDYNELAVPGVRSLKPYQPGKPIEELQREYGLSEIIKLASNENPLGPSPMAIKAIQKEIDDLARYPDGNGFALKTKLSEKLRVNTNQITLGNGSNDILEFVARTFVQPAKEVIFSEYSFAVYPLVTQAIGATPRVVPAKNWGHDLQAMLEAITGNTRLIFIANPNNPTGTWLTRNELLEFLKQVPEHVLVVLDEAYFEYAQHEITGLTDFPDGVQLLSEFENLIVTRTFSKAYGLAGLRAGYGLSNKTIADLLNRVRQPFNVNSLALAAATAALDDTEHLEQSIQVNKDGLNELTSAFDTLGLSYIPTAGNFISFDLDQPAEPINQALLTRGIIVRPIANYSMPNHLRVTIGTQVENAYFIQALTEILKNS